MKARIKLEGDVLEITFTDVVEADRSRLANITIELLRAYGNDRACPWAYNPNKNTYLVQIVRGDSDYRTLEAARKVLNGFALEV